MCVEKFSLGELFAAIFNTESRPPPPGIIGDPRAVYNSLVEQLHFWEGHGPRALSPWLPCWSLR